MTKLGQHPYQNLPNTAFWRRSVASLPMGKVDPASGFGLTIGLDTKVATAGSCFAQHIARHLKKNGFNYFVAEAGHPVIDAKTLAENNYGTFSARYGNIYTALQLQQLIQRLEGIFAPREAPWIDEDGTVRDPFRPAIQPGNFVSVTEMEADRDQHLRYVKKMFDELDVFVFTLGLTECWISKEDGAVFPLCPGVEGGVFDDRKYEFHNQTHDEVVENLEYMLRYLSRTNPSARVILTVSPVPLMATAVAGQHVLSATTYSKSVLRVAAQTITERFGNVHYFPSYEIITGSFNRGVYYSEDLRNVTEEGVSHVMRLFLKHAANTEVTRAEIAAPKAETEDTFAKTVSNFIEVECEEAALDRDENGMKESRKEASSSIDGYLLERKRDITSRAYWDRRFQTIKNSIRKKILYLRKK